MKKLFLVLPLLVITASCYADDKVKDAYETLNNAAQYRQSRRRWADASNTQWGNIIAQLQAQKSLRIQREMLDEERRHNRFEEDHIRYLCAQDPNCK